MKTLSGLGLMIKENPNESIFSDLIINKRSKYELTRTLDEKIHK